MRVRFVLGALLALACCHRAPAPAPTAPVQDAWIGRWVGVEGLALAIAPRDPSGIYGLTVTLMDGTRHYAGRANGASIQFDRDGRAAAIRHVAGSATGLKWLADKRDCLMIQPGEGFCRD